MNETEPELRQQTTQSLRQGLKEARADFQQTSQEIKRRLAADELLLEHRIRQNPVRSVLVGAGLGFLIGRASRHTAVMLALITGLAVGYSLADHKKPEPAKSDG